MSIGKYIEIGENKEPTSGTMIGHGSNQLGNTRAMSSQVVQGNLDNVVFS
jgi:hypothetical protein